MAGIDLNRTTTGVSLTPEESQVILAKSIQESAVLKLAERVELPGNGLKFQTITGDVAASWVGETNLKGNGVPSLGVKSMAGYTIQVTVPISRQFRRDKNALYNEIVRRLPLAIGKKFDETIFAGTDATKPGSDFDVFANCGSVNVETEGIYEGCVDAETAIAENSYLNSGYVFSPQGKAMLLKEKDNQERPYFLLDLKDGNTASVLGNPTYFTPAVYKAADTSAKTPAQYGICGDWSKAKYGIVEAINIEIADQASITIDGENVNLWEHNMFAIRAEAEMGFIIGDTDAFKRLVGTAPTANKAKASK